MAVIRHPATGLPTGDPERIPLKDGAAWPTREELDAAVSSLILSASGWRTVFGAEDESYDSRISAAHTVIAATAARVFAQYLKQSGSEPVVLIGMDSRPTGPAIADAMARVFLSEGCSIRYLFISAAPEIMAWAKTFEPEAKAAGITSSSEGTVKAKAAGITSSFEGTAKAKAAGFCYISASHNPIGHNGIKFGLTDGGVLPGSEASILIAEFRNLIAAPDAIETAAALLARADIQALARAYCAATQEKRAANSAYTLFTREVVSAAGELHGQDRFLDALAFAIRERPLGIVADLNGSARCLALDEDILTGIGVSLDIINGQAGAIAHRIVPEGASLEECRERLEELHHGDSAFTLGYVPDCDGDRGNIVIWDDRKLLARSLEAQEVFALCCVAELAHLRWIGHENDTRQAVVINDPTSLRIDRIAEAFGAKIFRAEVGEANAVGLARRLRSEGWTVRILGEGAAGGNITHPSSVRDPIDTVFALIKLLRLRSTADRKGLFEIWCEASGRMDLYSAEFTLADIIDTLPSVVTTSAYESEAMLKIRSENHARLKARYQVIFEREWKKKKDDMARRWGFARYTAWSYTGLEEKPIQTSYGEAGRGGLRILFSDAQGRDAGFIWMRGSGTEPVFRVMAEGATAAIERELLEWQRAMILEADHQEEK